MRTRRLLQTWLAVAALGLLAGLPVAHAETHPETALTLAAQTERADLVVVAEPRNDGERGLLGRIEVEFVVREVLAGEVAVGETLVVLIDDRGHAAPFTAGQRHLVFLAERRVRPDRTTFEPLVGAFSVRRLSDEEGTTRFPAIVRELAESLGRTATADAGELRRDLVRWVGDEDAGIAWSAAVDLAGRPALLDALTDDERGAVVRAFARSTETNAARRALATLCGAVGGDDAVEALVLSLTGGDASTYRAAVADALQATGRTGFATTRLRAALGEASGPARRHLLHALGRVGDATVATDLAAGLSTDDPLQRIECAHALGLLARRVRAEDPEERIAGREALTAALPELRTENEIRAVCWALAQLDEPAAYDVLRDARETDDRPSVRRWAESYLRRPRQSLVLRRR